MNSKESSKEVSKEFAFNTISKFLHKEWAKTTPRDITVSPLKGGYLNTLYIVENNGLPPQHKEPRKVIMRIIGEGIHWNSKFDLEEHGFVVNTEVSEALIYQHQSRTGNGPKIFGVFPGGRIEEFIKSHTLKHIEAERPEFITDVARAYARYHSTDLPLERNQLHKLFKNIIIDKEVFKIPQFKESKVDFDSLLSVDWNYEQESLKRVIESIASREIFVHFDCHFLNILVREMDEEEFVKNLNLRVMLIDYEFSFYGPRMFDFGDHFNAKMFDASNSGSSGHPYPPENQRRLFLREYLKEWKTMNPDRFDPEIDNEEHLLFESEIGSLFASLKVTTLLLSTAETFKNDPTLFDYCDLTGKFYLEKKKEIMNEHPELPF